MGNLKIITLIAVLREQRRLAKNVFIYFETLSRLNPNKYLNINVESPSNGAIDKESR